MTPPPPEWIDDVAMDRAYAGRPVGRPLTRAERLVLACRVKSSGGGTKDVARVCKVNTQAARKLLTEIATSEDVEAREKALILQRLEPEIVEILPAAQQLVDAVHDVNPEAVAAALGTQEHLLPLCIALAAMVPGDVDVVSLLGWATNPEEYVRLREAGVHAKTAALLAQNAATTQDAA